MQLPLIDLVVFIAYMVGIIPFGCSFCFRKETDKADAFASFCHRHGRDLSDGFRALRAAAENGSDRGAR